MTVKNESEVARYEFQQQTGLLRFKPQPCKATNSGFINNIL